MAGAESSDPNDPVFKDVAKFIQHSGGGILGMATGSETDFETSAERMRIAYSESWRRLYSFLLAESPEQTQLSARERMLAMFGRLFATDDTVLTSYATYAFLGIWGKKDDHMFTKILFEDQPEDRYLDHETHLVIEAICDQRESDNGIGSAKLASVLMYYAATIQLTRNLMQPGPSTEEATQGLARILDSAFEEL